MILPHSSKQIAELRHPSWLCLFCLQAYFHHNMKKLLYFLMVSLTVASCDDGIDPYYGQDSPALLSMDFLAADNPQQLTSDVKGEIIGDSVVEFFIPDIACTKLLAAKITFRGESVSLNGIPQGISPAVFDYRQPVTLTVTDDDDDNQREYKVYVHKFTGLPVVWIETAGKKGITSKDTYLRASFKLVENLSNSDAADISADNANIKGRGNSTWEMPKKPYKLKFDTKIQLLGEPKDKSWVLLANYLDKTFLRNQTAFYMGEISNLDYTPHFHFVELILNGRYDGTYQLGENLKVSKDRVNVGDDGFLLEIDAKAGIDEVVFSTPHLISPVNIKEPAVAAGDDNYNYIRDFVLKAENALFSDNFTDKDNGWQKYMDLESFVDWYLINEIAKNNDACLYSSCFMNLKRGGKLKMGPLWDFDIAFGNSNYNNTHLTSGFWIKNTTWFTRLFQDPAFVAKVKERFDYFYGRRNDIIRDINENATYLQYSAQENNNKWHTLYTNVWFDAGVSYAKEVLSLKEWINARFEWLKSEFDAM